MSQNRKTILFLTVFISAVLVFVVFVVYPLLSGIKRSSQDVLAQKNILAEVENKAKNLQQYRRTRSDYEQNLAKIDTLFVNQAEPVDFIEFLEKTASQLRLDIVISSLAQPGNFQLNLTGSFPNFLKFIEKLESGPYLIEISDLDIITGKYKISIKVYTK